MGLGLSRKSLRGRVISGMKERKSVVLGNTGRGDGGRILVTGALCLLLFLT